MTDQFTHIVDHPFIKDSLTHLRDKGTSLAKFRRHSDQLCYLLFAEAIRGLDFDNCEITTPLDISMDSPKLKDEVIIVPVLRSGLAMLFGAMQLLPKSKVGFVGLQRDEKTAVASEYYFKMPKVQSNSVVIITDPMLATGGSLLHLLKKVKPYQLKDVRIVSVISAPEGIALIRSEFPKVNIFTAAIDEKLNDVKYIMPGIGDYGDRYFGTND